jgi:hypothetical protein
VLAALCPLGIALCPWQTSSYLALARGTLFVSIFLIVQKAALSVGPLFGWRLGVTPHLYGRSPTPEKARQ